jgi:hypothetical protein
MGQAALLDGLADFDDDVSLQEKGFWVWKPKVGKDVA